jgi:hypothetical protein
MERKWAEEFVKGNIRINTLYGYQAVEHAEIGDAWEGFRIFDLDPHRSTKQQVDVLLANFPHLAAQLLTDPEMSKEASKDFAPHYPIQINELVPDCFMLCFAREFDASVMRNFGADTCIEITYPKEFFFSLSRAMQKHATFAAFSTCQYIDRGASIEVQVKYRPQVLKPPRLAHQKEVRFVWDPSPNATRDHEEVARPRAWNMYAPDLRLPELPLRPVYITQPEITKFCRILSTAE